MAYRILPPEDLPEAEVRLPLSKSMSNRALIINALMGEETPARAIAHCDDTAAMLAALTSGADEIDIDGAGTAMRFLTAFLACSPGREVTLTGNERMACRPIGPLVEALRRLGARIEYAGREGFPPLRICGSSLQGGKLEIDASMSSQYVSALLMVAPYMEQGLELTLTCEIGSMPYIDLTLDMMRRAGADAEREQLCITVRPGGYSRQVTEVEADWSAAAFWYEIEAVSSGFFTLLGLEDGSAQGDAAVARIYAEMSVNTEFTSDYDGQGPAAELTASPDISPRFVSDLSDHPDLTPAIVVTCALVGIPFRISGLETLRIKECDRIEALQRELKKIGVECAIPAEGVLEWDGRRHPLIGLPEFDTYGDHRMAMAFAPVSIYIPGIKIRDAEVVSKSYPEYWEHLQGAGFTLVDGDVSPDQLFADQ